MPANIMPSACRSLHSPNASADSKRRCRFASKCGATTRDHIPGKYYQLAETICVPEPIQKPRPRILIGGGGERKTLRLVARYADACNLFVTSPEQVKAKLDVLAEHCRNEGRDPRDIQVTVLSSDDPAADPDGFLRKMEGYAAIGVDLVEIMPNAPDPAALVRESCEKVVRRLSELGSAA